MSTSLVKPSKMLKSSTAASGQLLNAVQRATELYLAQVARAELELNERIRVAVGVTTAEATAPPQPDNGENTATNVA